MWRATAGSAGLDLCAATDTVLTSDNSPLIVPTGVFGPLPPNTFGLIFGRVSSTLQGIQVLPGILDNDFEGQIQIILSTTSDLITIPKETRLAQIIILPLQHLNSNFQKPFRGSSPPGSSDTYWVQQVTEGRPLLELRINGKAFSGIIDTGADATVISESQWPRNWPLTIAATHLRGIGQSTNPQQSSKTLKWEDNEGNQGFVTPYVLPNLPVNLWGRDILAQMKVVLYSPSNVAITQMLNQGFLPGQGLGKNHQGITQPISINPKFNKTGLGYTQNLP
nr:protease [Desmodus rotundus endogenous retrovirus]WOC29353.1 protease [Desmodus rotundus endogenous retrovirus]WOC29385.1 protease [Desmodus rotundus endogenous retrovirus]WOC29393.1 protease [Desmodus rotundus endogenous retrovirus]